MRVQCTADRRAGYNVWRTRFASDANIVGRRIVINDAPTTVIGVLPESFDFATVFAPGSKIDMYTAFPLTEENDRRGNTLAVVGRLKPGVTIEKARAEIVAIGKQLTSENRRRNTFRPKVVAFDERINGRFRPALFVLSCAVAVVMLIVSANLSSLQFARLSARQKELAVRVALGAGRGRLIRQTLTESLVLSLGGAIVGLGLTVAGTSVVSRLHAFDIPLLDRVGIDATAFGFAVLVAVITGVLIGLLPAIQTPASVYDALKESNRGSTRSAGHTRGSRRARRGGSGTGLRAVGRRGSVHPQLRACSRRRPRVSTRTYGRTPRRSRITVSGSGERERLLQ
jgi:hypothetical protein